MTGRTGALDGARRRGSSRNCWVGVTICPAGGLYLSCESGGEISGTGLARAAEMRAAATV